MWLQFSSMKAADGVIALREVYGLIHTPDDFGNPVPFSLNYVKLDRKKHTGGQLKRVVQCVAIQVFSSADKKKKTMSGGSKVAVDEKNVIVPKAPRHFLNGTFNIKILPSGLIRKVHYRLITRYNNKRVMP
jgi:hypothetical protein